ncbi:hypothetical protein ACOMHN_060754 [Nucella lapillus]
MCESNDQTCSRRSRKQLVKPTRGHPTFPVPYAHQHRCTCHAYAMTTSLPRIRYDESTSLFFSVTKTHSRVFDDGGKCRAGKVTGKHCQALKIAESTYRCGPVVLAS